MVAANDLPLIDVIAARLAVVDPRAAGDPLDLVVGSIVEVVNHQLAAIVADMNPGANLAVAVVGQVVPVAAAAAATGLPQLGLAVIGTSQSDTLQLPRCQRLPEPGQVSRLCLIHDVASSSSLSTMLCSSSAIRPRRNAMATAWVRLWAPSFTRSNF